MTIQRIKKAAIAATAVSLLVLTACSSSAPDEEAAEDLGGASGGSGLAAAEAAVAEFSEIIEGTLPSTPLDDAASLAGQRVIYIPAVAAIPFFTTSFTGLEQAFSEVGMTVEMCDGQANPANISACLDQALNGGAAGVIMDAVSPQLAQTSFDAVVAAGVPVVLGNIPVPEGSPDTVQNVGPDSALATSLAANSIIADAGGSTNVAVVEVIDSPVTISWMENGALQEFPANCPDCGVTKLETKTADLQNLPPKVSAALLADPDIKYLLPQLSPEVKPAIQGATDAGRTDVRAASTAAVLGDLQQVAADNDPLFAAVGWDVVRTGWLEADVMMRLILGQDPEASSHEVPLRIFNESNIGDLELTQAGWDSSDWFGGNGYQNTLKGLWK